MSFCLRGWDFNEDFDVDWWGECLWFFGGQRGLVWCGVGVCVCVFGQWGDNGMLEFEACVVD